MENAVKPLSGKHKEPRVLALSKASSDAKTAEFCNSRKATRGQVFHNFNQTRVKAL
jgi:hypothetical protein